MQRLSVLLFCLVFVFYFCSSEEPENSTDTDSGRDFIFSDFSPDTAETADNMGDGESDEAGTDSTGADILYDSGTDEGLYDIFSDVTSDSVSDAGSDIAEISDDIPDIQEDTAETGEDVMTEDAVLSDVLSGDDTGIYDAGIKEDYDRLLVVTHPFGPDGSTCGRNIEFFRFSGSGDFTRLNEKIEVGDCPVKARFSPDGRFLFVIVNNGHNPQAGTQAVVVLKKDNSGRYIKLRQFNEFSMQNPEYIAFSRDGKKAFVSDFDIEGEGGIHVIKRDGDDWVYKKEILLALPKSLVVLPDDRYAVVSGGEDPYDTAVLDIEQEQILSKSDLFNDFVDALGIDVTSDGRYVVIPNSSPYSELGNTLSVLEVDYSSGLPVLSLISTLPNVNEPSASLFTTDGKYLVVTNFSKNYSSLFNLSEGKLTLINKVTSMSLADTMTVIRKGNFRDYFFVNALSDIHILKIQGGQLLRLIKFPLGSGSENMLGDIDIEP